jgi:hypothetical protein
VSARAGASPCFRQLIPVAIYEIAGPGLLSLRISPPKGVLGQRRRGLAKFDTANSGRRRRWHRDLNTPQFGVSKFCLISDTDHPATRN